MPATSAELLTIADVAKQLSVDQIAVHRLIARGTLAAQRVGGNQWRITQADLFRYVTSGTPDLAVPPLAGPWFTNQELGSAENFPFLLTEAAQEQKLSPAEAEQRATSTVRHNDVITIPIRMDSAVRAVMRRPVSARGVSAIVPIQSSFKTATEAFIAWRLRFEVQQILRSFSVNSRISGSAIQSLYESPERYAGLTGDARTRFLDGQISFIERHTVSRNRMIVFRHALPHSQLIAENELASLTSLTF